MRLELIDAGLAFQGQPPLFSGLGLCLEAGELVVVEGPSGCGKTSLLRLLNRLQAPSSGRLRVDGRDVADTESAVELRRRAVLVPQTPVAGSGTVREHLCLPFAFRAHRHRRRPDDEALRAGLDDLCLDGVDLEHDAATLSVGQRQRLSLLRALLLEPELLLCDEPTAALDDDSRRRVEDRLEGLCETGSGVLVVSHQVFRPRRVAARRLRLSAGGLQELEP